MIRISINDCYDSHEIRVEGHAGYAEAGQDIVCAAISALCYALGETLWRHAEKGEIKGFYRSYNDGFTLRFRGENEASLGALEVFRIGTEMISENFPENIVFS